MSPRGGAREGAGRKPMLKNPISASVMMGEAIATKLEVIRSHLEQKLERSVTRSEAIRYAIKRCRIRRK